MRAHIIQILESLSKNGIEIKDADMIDWANQKIKSANKKSAAIRSFSDASFQSSLYFIDLLDAINPGTVDYSLVQISKDGNIIFHTMFLR